MLSEDKIKKMIRLSDYEKGQGATDLRRVCYSKMDYVRFEILKTILADFVATLLVLLLIAIYRIDFLLQNALSISFGKIGLYSGIGFLIICIVGVLVTCRRASQEYGESAVRAKEYYRTLKELMDLYEQEEQEANRI